MAQHEDRMERLEAWFHEARALDARRRTRLLERVRAQDASVADELEAMLAAADANPDTDFGTVDRGVARWLDDTDRDRTDTASTGPVPSIEGYEIRREIGRGGQGVVFLACQLSTQRDVALKLLLSWGADAYIERRFAREVELAAQLDDPRIVSVFDSGVTGEGLPFFVMAYVDGCPLDRHVREERPTTDDCVRLFAEIAEAVDHAHRHGILHRDLKPSNLLVDANGSPRLLDFGLAKALDDPPADAATLSRTGQVLGTPAYMSPEQARGERVDIRTDVYSLGVVFYRVACGAFPYDVDGSFARVSRHIVESAPLPPRVAAKRSRERDEPALDIPADLETILLTCLAKDPERRYATAGALAADLQRTLRREPIDARRDSRWYVLRRTASRYRVPIAAASLFVIGLVGALAFSLDRLARERTLRRDQTELMQSMRAFLDSDLLAHDDTLWAPGYRVTLSDALERTAPAIDERFARFPSVAASTHASFARVLSDMGEYAAALEHAERAIAGFTASGDADPPSLDYLGSELNAIAVLRKLGRLDEAHDRIDRAEELARTHHAEDPLQIAAILSLRAAIDHDLDRFEEARDGYEAAIGIMDASGKVDTQAAIRMRFNLAMLAKDRVEIDESNRILEDALRSARENLPPGDEMTLKILTAHSSVLEKDGRIDEAIRELDGAVSAASESLGAEHPYTLQAANQLANLRFRSSERERAIQDLQRVVEAAERRSGADSAFASMARRDLAVMHLEVGRIDLASTTLEREYEITKRRLGPSHSDVLEIAANLIKLRIDEGEFPRAVEIGEASYDRAMVTLGITHRTTQTIANNLAVAYKKLERFDAADPIYRELLRAHEESGGKPTPESVIARINLARNLTAQERFEEARDVAEQGVTEARTLFAGDNAFVAWARVALGVTEKDLGETNAALANLEAATRILAAALGDSDIRTRRGLEALVEIHESRGDAESARAIRERLGESAP